VRHSCGKRCSTFAAASYNQAFNLRMIDGEMLDLAEYLKSL